jgi:hypothetical protein
VNDPDIPGSLIDYARAACLCYAGMPGWFVAVCVAQDGTEFLWLVSEAELESDHPRCGSLNQPHEQLGRLPLEYVRRITIATRTHRCGRPTKSGTPCRTPVAHPGDGCAWHRTTTTERNSR